MPKTPNNAKACSGFSGKYAKYSKKYKGDWEQEPQFKGWLQESSNTCGAYCKLCKTDLRAHKNDLAKHAKTKIHQNNIKKYEYTPSTSKTLTSLGITTTATITEEMKATELRLASYIAVHSAIRSVDHLGELLNQIGTMKKELRLHRTKCAVLIKNVLSPCLLKDLIEDIGDSNYSLIIDESTDVSVHKYMAVCVRYFSLHKNTICTEYLGMFEVTRARAEDLYEGLKSFLIEINLNIKKVIGLGTDGANNLCGKNKSLFTLLQVDVPNLTLVKCVCHSIHLCASKATEQLPSSLDFLVRESYSWFSSSPLRKINYECLYFLINDGKKPLNLVQLSGTRWLSRYNCVDRILNQWIELKTHFEIAGVQEKCYTGRILADMYKDHTNYLYLMFLKPLLKQLNECNLLFQSAAIDIEIIYDNLQTLVFSLCRRVLIQTFIDKLNEVNWNLTTLSSVLENDLAYCPLSEIDYGTHFLMKVDELKAALSEETVQVLKRRCFNFLKELCLELHRKLPPNMKLLGKLKLFLPKVCLNQIRPKFNELPLNFISETTNISDLEEQWRNLLCVNWVDFCTDVKDTVVFWSCVLNYENAAKEKPFFSLASHVLGLLSLPVSNAVVERVFSVMNAVKTKPRNRMNLKMLDAILRIRLFFNWNKDCCKNFKPTKKMIELFTSQMYFNIMNNNDCASEEDMINVVWEIVEV